MGEFSFIVKKASEIQVGERFFNGNGDHSLVTRVEPLNTHYIDITYYDRWHNLITCPHEINQDVYMVKEVTSESHN